MPILPPTPLSAPYDTVSTILNAARVRCNDTIQALGGDLLTNTQPFTQMLFNSAWRSLQEFLANLGYNRLTPEVILSGVPMLSSQDSSAQVFVNWTEYFDGSSYFQPPNAPVLPADLIVPLRLWERQHGAGGTFVPMQLAIDGLPACQQGPFNGYWEWRNDSIYMPGARQLLDIRVRYAAYLPDFVTTGSGPTLVYWYNQPVPIMRCMDALADFVAAELTGPRGDENAAMFVTKGQEKARQLFNREASMKQRVNIRRQARSSRNY